MICVNGTVCVFVGLVEQGRLWKTKAEVMVVVAGQVVSARKSELKLS